MSGIPIKLLHEAVGFKVVVELVTGDCYHGVLTYFEDNMNLYLSDVDHIDLDQNVTQSDSTFIRGTNVLSVKVPDMLIHSSLFQDSKGQKKQSSLAGKIKRNFMTVKMKQNPNADNEWHDLFHNPESQLYEGP